MYNVSAGYIYPIFGAFRSLLRFDDEKGNVSWLFDPIEIWNEAGASIVQNTFETSNNPQLAGKDKQLSLIYRSTVRCATDTILRAGRCYGLSPSALSDTFSVQS